jgi:flagellar biogenesis protein FliO
MAIALIPPWCRETVLFRNVLLSLGLLLWPVIPASSQTPPPGPSEQALQAPLNLNDEKPTPGQISGSEPSAWRAFGSVVPVLGLAGSGLWAFRKWGAKRMPGSGGTRIRMEETLSLGDRRFVSILKADDEKFLIALSPQSVTLLARLNNPEMPTFGNALEQQMELNRPAAVRDMEALIKGDRS